MNDTIKLSAKFNAEERMLMGRCLQAITCGRFIDDQTLQTLTGWYTETFENLSSRFNDLDRVSQEEYEVIFQAVVWFPNYPIDNPRELEPFLGTSRLYLGWFGYKLMHVKHEWKTWVEHDARAVDRLSRMREMEAAIHKRV